MQDQPLRDVAGMHPIVRLRRRRGRAEEPAKAMRICGRTRRSAFLDSFVAQAATILPRRLSRGLAHHGRRRRARSCSICSCWKRPPTRSSMKPPIDRPGSSVPLRGLAHLRRPIAGRSRHVNDAVERHGAFADRPGGLPTARCLIPSPCSARMTRGRPHRARLPARCARRGRRRARQVASASAR